jgi:phage gp29-like protein
VSGPAPRAIDVPITIGEQFQNFSSELTPGVVSATFATADIGRMASLVDLTHQLRSTDGQFQTGITGRELSVTSCKWTIQPLLKADDGKRARKRAAAIAADLEGQLREAKGFADAMAHMVGESLLFGFAHVEPRYEVRNGKICVTSLHRIQSNRFGFRQSDGQLLYQSSAHMDPSMGTDIYAKYPGQVIRTTRRVTGDVPSREGLARLMVRLAVPRTWTLFDWLKLAEIGWKPTVKGTYPKTMGKDAAYLAIFDQALKRLASTNITRHDSETTMDVVYPTGAGGSRGSHKELIDSLGADIIKNWLGGTLMTDAGDSGGRALGNVQAEGLTVRRNSDLPEIAQSFRGDMFAHWTAWNYGPDAPVPLLAFATEDAIDLQQWSAMLSTLVGGLGLKVGSAYAYDIAGIPKPEAGEEMLGAKPDAPAQQDPTAKPDANPDGEEDPEAEPGTAGA